MEEPVGHDEAGHECAKPRFDVVVLSSMEWGIPGTIPPLVGRFAQKVPVKTLFFLWMIIDICASLLVVRGTPRPP